MFSEYLSYVLTTLPPSELINKELYIESERATLNEIAALYGSTVKVAYVDAIPAHLPAADFVSAAQKGIEGGSSISKAGSSNHLYPGYKWSTIKETLKL